MRYINRWLESEITRPRGRGKVRLVFGARQTGKSTLLARVAGSEAIVINLQDPAERLRYERRPELLVQRLEALEGSGQKVLIDEIQKVPALLESVQYLVDRFPRRYEFLLTGSSARRLRRSSANLLPGRSHIFDLFPLIAGERREAERSRLLAPKLPSNRAAGFRKARLEEVLLYGDLPGVTKEPVASRRATLEAYAEAYLQEEIRQEALVQDVGSFASFLEIAAQESGNLVNLAALSRTTGIPASTLKIHYQILVDTFVGYWIPTFGARTKQKVQKTPRFVFFDLGVRNATTGWKIDRSLLDHRGGSLLEQWVQLELIRRARYLGRGHALSTWRTRHGREVDAILETPREVIPLEVKWTQNPTTHDARHVEAFLDEYSPRARRGFLVCRTPEPLRLSPRVIAIPWQEL